jgi:hypothetical protein
MKFSISNAYRARAEHCWQQSHLTKDVQIKKYWDHLVDDWLALENNLLKFDSDTKAISSR